MTTEAKPLEIGQKYLDTAKAQPCRVKAVAGDVIQVEYGNGVTAAVEKARLRPYEPYDPNPVTVTPANGAAPNTAPERASIAPPDQVPPAPPVALNPAPANPERPVCGIDRCEWQPNTDQPSWWDMAMGRHRNAKHKGATPATPKQPTPSVAPKPVAQPAAAPRPEIRRVSVTGELKALLAEAKERWDAAEVVLQDAIMDYRSIETTLALWRERRADVYGITEDLPEDR